MTKLKIIKKGSWRGYGYKIQAPISLVRTVALDPAKFYYSGNEQCVFTLAKIYYKGGGWWWLVGYDYDMQDVDRVITILRVAAGDLFFKLGLTCDQLRNCQKIIDRNRGTDHA